MRFTRPIIFASMILIICFGFSQINVRQAFAQAKEKGAEKVDGGQAEAEAAAAKAAQAVWSGAVIRFVTESDFPPFNYYDEEGVLTGFNVDLARAICVQLEVRCDIVVKEWNALIPALNGGEADAVVASLAITSRNLGRVDLTNRYFQMPARFASQKDYAVEIVIPEEVEGEKIGVLKGTAHEAYLKDFFSGADIKAFSSAVKARDALKAGKISLLFGDGIGLMFWVNGTESAGCCVLRSGAFTEAKYFGEGMGIGVKKGNRALREVLNNALANLRKTGRFEELYLRYFPLRFY